MENAKGRAFVVAVYNVQKSASDKYVQGKKNTWLVAVHFFGKKPKLDRGEYTNP